MWVFTVDGFFSAVQHNEKPDLLCVRARAREDLVRLRKRLPGCTKISRSKVADYEFRVFVDKGRFSSYVRTAVQEIDYGNFKGRVLGDCATRSRAYHRVWHAMLDFQEEISGRLKASRLPLFDEPDV